MGEQVAAVLLTFSVLLPRMVAFGVFVGAAIGVRDEVADRRKAALKAKREQFKPVMAPIVTTNEERVLCEFEHAVKREYIRHSVFYADNVAYTAIPEPYGTTERK